MISFVTGKPGGGKGLLSVQQIIDELRFGKRPIITNLPLRIQPWVNGNLQPMVGLRAYLLRAYGKDFDCLTRVFILDDDDTASFYLYRVVDGKIVKSDANIKRVEKDGQIEERVMDFETTLAVANGPVFYVIDEAWKFYGSRNWQKTGEGMLFYSSQHRKFGDDVLIVTQHTKQIDPAILRVAQDFWTVTNHGNLTFGFFRQPSVFHVRIFDAPPTGAAMTPMSRKLFRLDRAGMAQCYDTSAGVGISGRAVADLGARKRGLPLSLMFLIAIVAIVCLFKGFSFLPQIVAYPFHKHNQTLVQHVVPKPAPPSPELQSLERQIAQVESQPHLTNDIQCLGYTMFSNPFTHYVHVQVMLSDGRIADSDYGEVQSVSRWSVRVFGEKYKIRIFIPSPSQDVIQQPNETEQFQPSPQNFSSEAPGVSTLTIGQHESSRPQLQGVQQRMQQRLTGM